MDHSPPREVRNVQPTFQGHLQLPSILHYALAMFKTILVSFRAHGFFCIDQAQFQPQPDDNRPEDDVSVLGPRQHQFQGIVPYTI